MNANSIHFTIRVVIYEGLYFDLAQGQLSGVPNETFYD